MCCKLLPVPALEKPAGAWCQHCVPGVGCGIHLDRPNVCRAFSCLHTYDLTPPDCRPDATHVVLFTSPEFEGITAVVDPNRPTAWETGAIGRWIKAMVAKGVAVKVVVGESARVLIA